MTVTPKTATTAMINALAVAIWICRMWFLRILGAISGRRSSMSEFKTNLVIRGANRP